METWWLLYGKGIRNQDCAEQEGTYAIFGYSIVMVQDSQYPFKEGEKIRIVIDPYRKMMIVSSTEEPQIKVSPDGFVIRGKKIEIARG